MKPLLQARDKRVRAVELFASGLSYTQIAREVGFSNRGSAHRAVTKGLAMHGNETIETIRTVNLDRLEALHAAHWEAATAGDLQALDIVLKAGAQRRRWYGTVEKVRPKPSTALYGGAVLVQPWLEAPEGNAGEATDQHAARRGRQSQ